MGEDDEELVEKADGEEGFSSSTKDRSEIPALNMSHVEVGIFENAGSMEDTGVIVDTVGTGAIGVAGDSGGVSGASVGAGRGHHAE